MGQGIIPQEVKRIRKQASLFKGVSRAETNHLYSLIRDKKTTVRPSMTLEQAKELIEPHADIRALEWAFRRAGFTVTKTNKVNLSLTMQDIINVSN